MNKYANYIPYVLVLLGVLLASVGIFYDYSYWWDELYSVTAAELSYTDMFGLFIFNDVHPPLYTMILNVWVSLFGSSEQVTRTLSFAFSVLALGVVWSWSKKSLDRIGFQTVIIFFSTSSLFAFYAQETRSYSMMLFLSAVLTFVWLSDWHKSHYGKLIAFGSIAIALSLTHYFGLVYAGLILIFSLYENLKDPKKASIIVASGIASLAWPTIHFLYGSIGSKTGDNFWIKSEGWQSTLSSASSGLVPQFNVLSSKILGVPASEYLAAIVFLVLLGGLFLLARLRDKALISDASEYLSGKIIILFLLFLAIVAVIDSHSPISTRRNYIVLLPLFSIFLGLAAQGLKKSGFKWVFLVLVVGGIGNLGASFVQVSSKSSPHQDHAAAVDFIERNAGPEDNIYYLARPGSSMPEVQKLMAEYYFKGDQEIIPVTADRLSDIEPPFFYFLQHQKNTPDELAAEMSELGLKVDFYIPQKNNSVMVVYGE